MTKSNVVSGKNQSFYKSYFSMTLVIALQNLVVYSVSLADNVMLGGYSELALSGVALCNQIQYFLQMTVMGIGAAMVVLASQFWGKKDTQSVQKIIAVGFWVAVAVSMLLWCAAFFFPHGCLGLLTDDQEVIGEGVKYLKIICFTYVFFGMTNTLLAGLRSVETVRIGFLVSGSTLVINVCLNYLLIYGNFGAPRLGSQGAAIATLTSRIVEFGIICFYLKAVDRKIRFQFQFPDSGVSLDAGQTFQLNGMEATLDGVTISPLSIQVDYTVREKFQMEDQENGKMSASNSAQVKK